VWGLQIMGPSTFNLHAQLIIDDLSLLTSVNFGLARECWSIMISLHINLHKLSSLLYQAPTPTPAASNFTFSQDSCPFSFHFTCLFIWLY